MSHVHIYVVCNQSPAAARPETCGTLRTAASHARPARTAATPPPLHCIVTTGNRQMLFKRTGRWENVDDGLAVVGDVELGMRVLKHPT